LEVREVPGIECSRRKQIQLHELRTLTSGSSDTRTPKKESLAVNCGDKSHARFVVKLKNLKK
jgi:hypothetical protein